MSNWFNWLTAPKKKAFVGSTGPDAKSWAHQDLAETYNEYQKAQIAYYKQQEEAYKQQKEQWLKNQQYMLGQQYQLQNQHLYGNGFQAQNQGLWGQIIYSNEVYCGGPLSALQQRRPKCHMQERRR